MMLAIRLPSDIEERLERLAKATGRTKTYYAREAILEHLDDLEDLYLGSTKNRVAIRRRIPIGLISTGGISVKPSMRSRAKRAIQMNAETQASRQVPHTSWCSPSGSIPARAGEPRGSAGRQASPLVYPRACGGTFRCGRQCR